MLPIPAIPGTHCGALMAYSITRAHAKEVTEGRPAAQIYVQVAPAVPMAARAFLTGPPHGTIGVSVHWHGILHYTAEAGRLGA